MCSGYLEVRQEKQDGLLAGQHSHPENVRTLQRKSRSKAIGRFCYMACRLGRRHIGRLVKYDKDDSTLRTVCCVFSQM